MTQQIEPCPNCKMPATRGDEEATDHATEYSPVGYHMRFFCCCVQCGMKGPIEDLPELADGNWNRIARAVREAQEQRERAEKAEAERNALLWHLSTMFDAYENGVECYEDPDEEAGYMGRAFKLPEDEFAAIADILDTLVPRPLNNTQ